jgi:ribosomal-protein-alanine N-acetyltransferase
MLQLSFTEFPVIETERLVLREIGREDANRLLILRSDPEVLRYIDREPMQTMAEAEEWVQKVQQSFTNAEGVSWVTCLKERNELIGVAGLWRIIKEHYRAEIGYTLMPEYWNLGLMTEALKAIIDFGFKKMNLHSIEANINPDNIASIKTAEKLGFVREAYFRENYFFNGQFLDSAIYSLLNKEQ